MKFYAIACEVFAREFLLAAAKSPHIVTLSFQPFGLHNTPDDLRVNIQKEIDANSNKDFDGIILGYGLCSRGTAELTAREIPLVIPRSHDCIALLLGSNARYQKEFGGHPGTYYYSPGWIERKEGEVDQGAFGVVKERELDERFQEYVEKYGEDNARYLVEQEKLWQSNYNRAAFINMGLGDIEEYRRFTSKIAENNGWSYSEIPGDMRLIEKLLFGEWNSDAFLIVQPGQKTFEAVNDGIISAE